jgi:outer membrane lipopolysaccharide assembly protein LptE/RlpB
MRRFSGSSIRPAFPARRAIPAFLASLARCARPAFLACLAFLAAASLTLAACGYQFRVDGQGPTIGGATAAQAPPAPTGPPPRLSIANFENKAFEPNLELKYTAYARKEFAAGSGARIVNVSEPKDYVLKGAITSVILPTLAFSITEGTQETRVTVTVKANVEDAGSGKVVWSQAATASSEFFVTNDLQFNRVLQTRALEQAGRLIAEDLATRFMAFLDAKRAGLAATPGGAQDLAPTQVPGAADRPMAR